MKLFKQAARHTNCFKNKPCSLAIKHQFMLATHSSNLKKSSLEVTDVSIMPVDVPNEGTMSTLKQRVPDLTEAHMAKMCLAVVYITVRGCLLYMDLLMDCLHF